MPPIQHIKTKTCYLCVNGDLFIDGLYSTNGLHVDVYCVLASVNGVYSDRYCEATMYTKTRIFMMLTLSSQMAPEVAFLTIVTANSGDKLVSWKLSVLIVGIIKYFIDIYLRLCCSLNGRTSYRKSRLRDTSLDVKTFVIVIGIWQPSRQQHRWTVGIFWI